MTNCGLSPKPRSTDATFASSNGGYSILVACVTEDARAHELLVAAVIHHRIIPLRCSRIVANAVSLVDAIGIFSRRNKREKRCRVSNEQASKYRRSWYPSYRECPEERDIFRSRRDTARPR